MNNQQAAESAIIIANNRLEKKRLQYLPKIKRPKDIELEWYTEEGTWVTSNMGGMTSRIIQHEIDHLNGVVFQNKAHRLHLQKAEKDRKLSVRRRKRLEEE